MKEINGFHAHLYYDQSSIEHAKKLRASAGERFGLELGRMHERPVGPHPAWSCQLSVPVEKLGDVIQWLCVERGPVDVFVHPLTGNDLWDHTEGVMWLGKSYELSTAMFDS